MSLTMLYRGHTHLCSRARHQPRHAAVHAPPSSATCWPTAPASCCAKARCKGQLIAHSSRHSAGDSRSGKEQEDQQQFKGLAARLQQLSFQELQQLCSDPQAPDSQTAFSASFLFWLSAQEKRAVGSTKQELSNLAAQLVYIKEQADWEASRRMLPPLASSLAYSNYSTWQSEHEGQQLPQVAPGISIPDLYKAAEREEAKLKQWQTIERRSSTLDSFAASSGYKQMAADAMARVRARLKGWADDETFQPGSAGVSSRPSSLQQQQQQQYGQAGTAGPGTPNTPSSSSSSSSSALMSPAAQQVLVELLLGCCCREERATVLPEAFTPPGLEVSAAVDGGSSEGPMRIVTTPQRVLAVIAHQLEQLQQTTSSSTASSSSSSSSSTLVSGLQHQHQLPSGEGLQQVLLELQEDISDFDKHVYSRMSRGDMLRRML